jgi:hypothetical protein
MKKLVALGRGVPPMLLREMRRYRSTRIQRYCNAILLAHN